MARACSLNRHGEALARAPGRHARPHPGPPPLRLVLGLLVVVALVLAATLMPAVALAEEGDGGAESSDTSGTEGTEGTEGTAGAEDSVGLANDEDPGVSAGVSTGGPSDIGGPAASPGYTSPTQHEGIPPGPSAPPYSGNPYGPNPTSVPNMDVLCCPGPGPTSGPGGNTGEVGQHESDE
jgi:hypothetical protein